MRNRSVVRMRIWSTHPPKYPATAPKIVPTSVDRIATVEADPQRDLPGVEDLAEIVATELIGAEQVVPARGLVSDPSVRSCWPFGNGASQSAP